MQINMVSLKCEVDDKTKDYILKKLKKIEKYFNDDISAKVVTKNDGKLKRIEVTIPTKKFIIRSEESRNDLMEAIDIAVDKIERQIRKNKTKMQKKVDKFKSNEMNFIFDDDTEDVVNNIMKRKTIETKLMSEEEAILQMNLLNHDFYVFKNAENSSISVVYKRRDGNYGIIDSK